jgi:beta-apo-4'-carotenal oxygenase
MALEVDTNAKLPPFETTPMDEISNLASKLRTTFKTNKTKDLEYRLVQLRKLYWGLKDCNELLEEGLMLDMNKPPHDAQLTEIDWAIQDCMFTIQNLTKWVQDDKDVDVPLTMSMTRPRIRKEPLGAVLIIGTYNLPINLNICPLIGAIAAGCPAVVKPSENAPATAMAIKVLMTKYLDPDAYVCVTGTVPETSALLNEKWEKIFYTGGYKVAKIIAKKAAETLTPVCLELGGRNPAFVTKNADLYLAARRLMWGKSINAGQVCMSHNYVVADREIVQDLVKVLNATSQEFYPQGPKNSTDFGRIINTQQFDRMKKMLDTTKGKIVMGGETNRDERYIAPTAVLVDSPEDSMIQEESFGPIWAILPYDDIDKAIALVNNVDPTPLSLMTFGSKSENEKRKSIFSPRW